MKGVTDMLRNKTAIVTGGTRGIGFATVKAFLENGARVYLFGSRKETVDKAISNLLAENPSYRVKGMYPDLSNAEEMKEAFLKIENEVGRIDILVNNAGISSKESIYDYTSEEFDRIMDINVKAAFNGIRAVAPMMKANGGGVILNTSSMVSIYGTAAGAGYPASKFAINGLTKSLAREMGRDGIRVNAVAPGIVNTDMVKSLPKEMRDQIRQGIPLQRMAKPEDIANAFVFLASDMASYISGAVLSVDGAAIV